jgi:aspartyl-tRNA(Asn)/glutamyl-tRNA(Gln) amidotransferase subunit C
MIDVNEALIRKVAALARLELNEQEIQEYVQSIGDILKHVDELAQVDIAGVAPMYHGIDDSLKLREDIAIPFPTDENGKPKILQCAPDVLHDGFKVPQIIG